MNKNNKIAIGIILVSLAALSVLSLLGFNGRKQYCPMSARYCR